MTHHLAQINLARLAAPLDDPKISEFVAQPARSTHSPMRLRASSGGSSRNPATPPAFAYNDDPFVIVNMSVWESIEALRTYAYKCRSRESVSRPSQLVRKDESAQLLSLVDSNRPYSECHRGPPALGALSAARRTP